MGTVNWSSVPYTREWWSRQPKKAQPAAPASNAAAGLPAQIDQQQQEANAANESRYQQGLGELNDLRKRAMEKLEGYGQARESRIEQQYGELGSRLGQSMVGRGLANTTAAATAQVGAEREKQGALSDWREQIGRYMTETDIGLTQNVADWIYKRNDTGPNVGMYAELMQRYGSAGGAV